MQQSKTVHSMIGEYCKKENIPFSYSARGGMFGFFFSETLPKNFNDVSNSNIEMFSLFFKGMLERNIYLPPSAYESCFISTEHNEDKLVKAAKTAIKVLDKINNEV